MSKEGMSKRHIFLTIGALAASHLGVAQASPGCPVQPASMKAMRNCYRPVLVFAASARDPSFSSQQALLEQYADDMMDRNLLYVPVLAKPALFNQPLDAPYVMLTGAELKGIRERFHVGPSEFMVILVGKDGGEKFRSSKPVSVLKLDALVDAMPVGSREKSARTSASH
jgi:hypothetical protein